MTAWTWIAASCRGSSHERSGLRLQDAQSCFVAKNDERDVIVAIVSDGAGTASHGGQGASLICRSIGLVARQHFSSTSAFPSDAQFETWVDYARDRILLVAQRRGLNPRDFAATLICAISDGDESLIAHVGDGCAALRDDTMAQWVAASWPDHGEYASTTSFLTDEDSLKLRLTRYVGAVNAVALFSDGLERLALDFVAKQPFAGFLDAIFRPVAESKSQGRDRALSVQLREFLRRPAINERTDDDKTLLLAVRK